MFDLSNQYKLISSLPIISSDYRVLHFDEYPILFSGTNRYGNKILGSLSYEDYENDYFRYFVIILTDKSYNKFLNRKVSYLELFKENNEIFVLDKDINDRVLSTYQIPLSAIPEDFLPRKNSYIPNYRSAPSLNYSFRLKGKLADLHKALVGDVNNVSQRIYNYLEESFKILEDFGISPKIYLQPSQTGSYRVNFDVDFEQQESPLFPYDKQEIVDFMNQYLNYVAYILPEEEENVLIGDVNNSDKLSLLKRELENIYNKVQISPTVATYKLVEGINSSAAKLTDVTEYIDSSNSFETLELGNYTEDGNVVSIGELIPNYRSSILERLLPEYVNKLVEKIETDDVLTEYRILVYRLNRETGKGAARLYFQDENYNKVNLSIDVRHKALSNSIFTKSLDEDKVVTVTGIATKRNSVYKKLKCVL
jgi:hypothetical protein